MKNNVIKDQFILFMVMFIIALVLDPMNIMIYSFDDYSLSKPLIFSALYMASTMIWGHQIVHLLQKGLHHFNTKIFFSGLFLSLLFMYILRTQLFFNLHIPPRKRYCIQSRKRDHIYEKYDLIIIK